MKNLLEETLRVLAQNNKIESDVLWVGTNTHKTNWQDFKKVSNVHYDDDYGEQEVAKDLLVVGRNWWLERREYDGSESWAYKEPPIEPNALIELKALTIGQASELGFDVSVGWCTLLEINGKVRNSF